ncbi:FecR family protein [Chitinophaga flava]|nr:FecR domain-containing protein [Chitinophaga flava]
MMEKIGGIINAADEAYLDHLIETDSVAATLWQQTKKLYSSKDIDNGFSRFDHLPWQDITALPINGNKAGTEHDLYIWPETSGYIATPDGIFPLTSPDKSLEDQPQEQPPPMIQPDRVIPLVQLDKAAPLVQQDQQHDIISLGHAATLPPSAETTITTASDSQGGRIHRLIRTWAAAAALLFVAATSWWYFRSVQTPHRHLSLSDKNKGVQLQLANGKVVNLSTDSGTIALQKIQFNNNNKTLSLATSTIDESKGNEKLTLAVPAGLDYKVQLPDGSYIWLNSTTTMRFSVPFSGASRDVFIDGEAFIQVAKDVNRPFFVHTAHSTVQVLGTSFNINSYDKDVVKVSLVDGAVKMKDGEEEVTLKPGQQAVATGKGIQVRPFDEMEELSWRQGLFYFSGATLSEISRVLPRWFGIPVIMDNNRIAKETFTGSIDRNQPIIIFLDDLKSTTTVDYYFDNIGRLHFK